MAGSLDTFVLSFIFTRSLKLAGSIAITEMFTKMALTIFMRDFGLQFPGTSGAKGIPSLICSDAGTLAGSVVFNRSRWLRLLTESDKEASMSRHSRACEGTAGFSLPELQNRSPGRLLGDLRFGGRRRPVGPLRGGPGSRRCWIRDARGRRCRSGARRSQGQ